MADDGTSKDGRKNRFTAYGLTFETNAAPPYPDEIRTLGRGDPVRIEMGLVPANLRPAVTADEFVQVTTSDFLFRCEHAPAILVTNGSVVRAERRNAETSEQHYWNSVLSIGASFVGLQRGHYPLHAAAVVSNDICVAFAGPSGVGKSTFAAGLCCKGARLVTDDLSLIRREGADWHIGAGPLYVRLLPDALARLPLKHDGKGLNSPGKRYVRLPRGRDSPRHLSRVYFLTIGELPNGQRIRSLSRSEAMQYLLRNNRLFLRLDALPRIIQLSVFKFVSEISSQLEFYEVHRSGDPLCFASLLTELHEHIAMEPASA